MEEDLIDLSVTETETSPQKDVNQKSELEKGEKSKVNAAKTVQEEPLSSSRIDEILFDGSGSGNVLQPTPLKTKGAVDGKASLDPNAKKFKPQRKQGPYVRNQDLSEVNWPKHAHPFGKNKADSPEYFRLRDQVHHLGHVYVQNLGKRTFHCMFSASEAINCPTTVAECDGKYVQTQRKHRCLGFRLGLKKRKTPRNEFNNFQEVEEDLKKIERFFDENMGFLKREIDNISQGSWTNMEEEAVVAMMDDFLSYILLITDLAILAFSFPGAEDERIAKAKAYCLNLTAKKWQMDQILRRIFCLLNNKSVEFINQQFCKTDQLLDYLPSFEGALNIVEAEERSFPIHVLTHVNYWAEETTFASDLVFKDLSKSFRNKPRPELISSSKSSCSKGSGKSSSKGKKEPSITKKLASAFERQDSKRRGRLGTPNQPNFESTMSTMRGNLARTPDQGISTARVASTPVTPPEEVYLPQGNQGGRQRNGQDPPQLNQTSGQNVRQSLFSHPPPGQAYAPPPPSRMDSPNHQENLFSQPPPVAPTNAIVQMMLEAQDKMFETFAKHFNSSQRLEESQEWQRRSHLRRNDYVTEKECELDPPSEWYQQFESPWNTVPKPEKTKVTEIKKLQLNVPKLKGTTETYLPFRKAFVTNFHSQNITVDTKGEILYNLLDGNNSKLESICQLIYMCGEEGYPKAIKALERAYGGSDRIYKLRKDVIRNLPKVPNHDAQALREFVARCQIFAYDSQFESFIVYEAMRECFSKHYKVEFDKFCKQNNIHKPTVKQFMSWLEDLEEILSKSEVKPRKEFMSKPKEKVFQCSEFPLEAEPKETSLSCEPSTFSKDGEEDQDLDEDIFEARTHLALLTFDRTKNPLSYTCGMSSCDDKHLLSKCGQFLKMTVRERQAYLMQTKRCRLCFHTGHIAGACTKKFSCKICKKSHNTLVHQEESDVVNTGRVSLASDCDNHDGFVALRTVTVLLKNPVTLKTMTANALLDDGSTRTLVTKEAADKLELIQEPMGLQLHGITGSGVFDAPRVEILISSITGTFQEKLCTRVIPELLNGWKVTDWKKLAKKWTHLEDLPFVEPSPDNKVHILIGQDYAHLMSTPLDLTVGPGAPIARKTPLGWTATGHVSHPDRPTEVPLPNPDTTVFVGYAMDRLQRDGYHEELNELFKAWIDLDKLDEEKEDNAMSNNDRYAIRNLKKSITFEDGRYQAKCLWKKGEPQLMCNQTQAMTRLNGLERMDVFKDPTFRKKYYDKILDYQQKGYVEKIPPNEVEKKSSYYLAHFPVKR